MNFQRAFAGIQQLGRALMLPIAVLPVAGLLLRLGQPDLLNIPVMAQAGAAIFDNLALLFAVGVAVGFAEENNGSAGLAGAIGYMVLTATLKVMPDSLVTWSSHLPALKSLVMFDDKGQIVPLNMGVLAGILAGLSAGLLYNRYKDIKLPSYLAFFGGKRFIPIATGFAMLLAGIVLGGIWPPIQSAIDHAGHWLIGAGSIGLFFYGVLNRILIVTGLHHILNSLVWFVFGSYPTATGVATGDLNRFFAGDPSAGAFMAGFFPIMMFGLPAACLAMYRNAHPSKRKAVAGILLSMALTAFLTGVTEPVEFAFMFLAPFLYVIHAILTGLSLALMHILDVRLGFTFSAGLFDYLLSYGKGEHSWMLLPVGLVYFVVYYVLFDFCIRRFNLPTLGREPESEADGNAEHTASIATKRKAAVDTSNPTEAIIQALGGAQNLQAVDACTTRLRLQVADNQAIDENALRALGARGFVRPAPGILQVIIGLEADQIASRIRTSLKNISANVAKAPKEQAMPSIELDRLAWLAALGDVSNIQSLEAVSGNRLRVQLYDLSMLDADALRALGIAAVAPIDVHTVHLVLTQAAAPYAEALKV